MTEHDRQMTAILEELKTQRSLTESVLMLVMKHIENVAHRKTVVDTIEQLLDSIARSADIARRGRTQEELIRRPAFKLGSVAYYQNVSGEKGPPNGMKVTIIQYGTTGSDGDPYYKVMTDDGFHFLIYESELSANPLNS